jgi:hypothetical protein
VLIGAMSKNANKRRRSENVQKDQEYPRSDGGPGGEVPSRSRAAARGLEIQELANVHTVALYPALARLERLGVLRSWFAENEPEDESEPRQRMYQLVDKTKGEAFLAEVRAY